MSPHNRPAKFDNLAILAEGAFELEAAKTAVGIIRYGRTNTVAVIDSKNAGKTVDEVIKVGQGIPIAATMEDALKHNPDALVIGIAPKGGSLPEAWRHIILTALEAGLDIHSGLHTFLNEDQEIRKVADDNGCILVDFRKPPKSLPVADGVVPTLPNNVVLTVGTDCCVGKMSVSLELTHEARRRDLSADFVATGQTGIMIWGRGISVDAVVADFIAGATEQMILDSAREYDWIFVEGQGSLYHPGYSGVTMGLIHGSGAGKMVLCHVPPRKGIRNYGINIPPLPEVIDYHLQVTRPLFETTICGIALNTWAMEEAEARDVIAQTQEETGLAVTDCVRFGAAPILDALVKNEGCKNR